MRLQQIEIFHAVYTNGSISAAARKLNVSQPAVSKALRHTEDQLGFLLFERTGQGLVPTEEAHRLFEEASKVHLNVVNMRRIEQNLRSAFSGHIRISTVTGLSFELLPQAIANFRRTNPGTTFELQTQHYGDLVSSLRSYENDIGLVFSAPEHSGLQRLDLGKAEFTCVYTGNLLLDKPKRVSLSEVAKKKYIAMNPNGPLGKILWQEIQKEDGRVDPVAIAESCFVAKSLAASGIGIAIVDEFTGSAGGHKHLKHKKLDPPLTFEVNALYAQARPLQVFGQKFLNCFRSVLHEYIEKHHSYNL